MNPTGRRELHVFLILLTLASVACALSAHGAMAIPPPRPGSTPEFGISANVLGKARYLTDTQLLVRVWGGPQYDSLAVGETSVELSPGITWISGDTLRHVMVSSYWRGKMSDRRWVVTVRPTQTGRRQVRFVLRIDGGPERGIDETEFVMPFEVQPDTVRLVPPPHITRFERVRDGKRYRFADGYLVPIDTTEAFLESDIAVKPRVLSSTLKPVPEGSTVPADGVPFAVMIGEDGRILGAEVLDEPGRPTYPPRLIEAARRSIEGWRFAPALAGGQAVPDYLVVRVRFGPPE